jgi:hypothetical protein
LPILSFHQELHIHHLLTSGSGTVNQIVTDVQSGLRLSPLQETKKNDQLWKNIFFDLSSMYYIIKELSAICPQSQMWCRFYLIHQAIKIPSSEQDSNLSFLLQLSPNCRHNSFKGLVYKGNKVLSHTHTFGNFTDFYKNNMRYYLHLSIPSKSCLVKLACRNLVLPYLYRTGRKIIV